MFHIGYWWEWLEARWRKETLSRISAYGKATGSRSAGKFLPLYGI
jgi:hypothetical protein